MKRNLCILFSLLLLLLNLTACDKPITAKITDEGLALSEMVHPPFLTLVCGEHEVQTKSPRCQWNRPNGTAIFADGPFVFDLWLEGDLEALPISPGEEVELRFECVPDRITVTAWKAECATQDRSRIDERIELIVTDGTFTLPSDGAYLYSLHAEWDKQGKVSGDASYAFATDRAD